MRLMINRILFFHIKTLGLLFGFLYFLGQAYAADLDSVFKYKEGFLWRPFLEWSLTNGEYSKNPFDVKATVTFVHDQSGEKRKTEMFYDGKNIWKFRFTGTQLGIWRFTTTSEYPDLNGKSGRIFIKSSMCPLANF